MIGLRLRLFLWLLGLTVADCRCARADDAPAAIAFSASWSSRAGLTGDLQLLLPALQQLHVYAEAGLPAHVGASRPGALEGVAPAHLGAGVAFVQGWRAASWSGYVLGALDVGLAEATYGTFAGGRLLVDLQYAQLYGDGLAFAGSSWSTTYGFGVLVRPVVPIARLWFDCDSRDGASEERAKPCGVGAGVRVHIPRSPVTLVALGKLTFFDLAGNLGDIGGRVVLLVDVDNL